MIYLLFFILSAIVCLITIAIREPAHYHPVNNGLLVLIGYVAVALATTTGLELYYGL